MSDKQVPPDNRLIFFEGHPGSGKTTLSRKLLVSLLRDGCPVQWRTEIHFSRALVSQNPDVPFGHWTMEQLDAAVTLFFNDHILPSLKADEVVILDAIWQVVITYLQYMGAGEDEIVDYVAEAIDRFQWFKESDPAWIYFRSTDPRGALKETMKQRGADWTGSVLNDIAGTPLGKRREPRSEDSLLEIMLAHCRLTGRLYPRLNMKKIEIEDGGKDWDVTAERVERFLGVTIGDPLPLARTEDLSEFSGSYTNRQSGHTITLGLDGQGLYFDDEFGLRLVRMRGDLFTGLTYWADLDFIRDSGGNVTSFRFGDDFPDVNLNGTLWEKE